MSAMQHVDTVVVGAGPVGLLMAAELARHGVRVRLLEQRPAPSTSSKALAVHPRTLEIFDDLELVQQALARGRRLRGVSLFAGSDRIAHFALDELDSPYPFVLVLPQSETERLLAVLCSKLGVETERECKVVGVEQDDEGVSTWVHRADGGDERLRSRWIVGCDGSHSTVRQSVGIPFEGEDIDAHFVLADLRVEWDREPSEAVASFSPHGVMLFIPLPEPGLWRIVASVSPEREGAPEATLARVERLCAERTDFRPKLSRPRWLSSFTIRQRMARQYRHGNVLLAGDAAHSHSPVGGQGMNTGLQDAYNLGWKLALVARGIARPQLLDSYHEERAPVASGVLRATGLGTRAVTLEHPASQYIRNRVVSFASSHPGVRRRIAEAIGELTVDYRRSSIVAEDRSPVWVTRVGSHPTMEEPTFAAYRDFGAGPRAGDRAPDAALAGRRIHEVLRGTRHTLLLFDGASTSAEGYRRLAWIMRHLQQRWGELVAPHVVVASHEPPEGVASAGVLLDPDVTAHRRYGATAECLYLIRPDGYIGYRTQPAIVENLDVFLERLGI